MINDLHGSPAIKRGIWQTIQIIEELADVGSPENITLEVAREDGKKGRRTQNQGHQWRKKEER